MVYTENHTNFLHNMLNNGIMDMSKGLEFVSAIWGDESKDDIKLPTIIKEINEKISKFKQQIKIMTCDISHDSKIVFIRTVNDKRSRLNVFHTPAEYEFFKIILNSMIQEDDFMIPVNTCLNFRLQLEAPLTLSLVRAQELLDIWSNAGYFIISDDDNLMFGARTIAEFEVYFNDTFEGRMKMCTMCMLPTFYGGKCNGCSEMFHHTCKEKVARKVCPSCKEQLE